jgi:hypothetical protein
VVRIVLQDHLDIAQEFFRWEIGTATAGALLGINAFDQPNVQESKDNTARLLKTLKDDGRLPEEEPTLREGSLALYTDASDRDLHHALESFLWQARTGDYVALMAYVMEQPTTQKQLQHLRNLLRDRARLATTVGYGPRFLHSTGQLHKGGPNTGLFMQFTADDQQDVDIPDRAYSFGTLKRAQALGDLQALRKHDRRVVRIHLGSDPDAGLETVGRLVKAALAGSVRSAGG